MSRYLFLFLTLTFIIFGCAKKNQLHDLVESGKFKEANDFVKQLSDNDKSNPETKALIVKINAALLSDSASELTEQKQYLDGVILISNHLEQFSTYPQVHDSLNRIMINIAFTGASFFDEKKDYISAYNCLEPLGSLEGLLSEKQSSLLAQLTKSMLSGIWEGQSEKHKLHIAMRIDPMTQSTFAGRVQFKEAYILTELNDGFFNGSELSATYLISQSHQGVKGKYSKGNLVMKFPIVVTETKTTDFGGGEGTSYYSHIVEETCIMKKTKSL